MLLLRKIDCYGQLILAGLMVSSAIILLPGKCFLLGLYLLGCWQIVSAILNTHSFAQAGFTNRIYRYWAFCTTDLILLFFSFRSGLFAGFLITDLLFLVSLIGCFAIAGYYWWIYYRLIGFLFIRNELDGLTKSKH